MWRVYCCLLELLALLGKPIAQMVLCNWNMPSFCWNSKICFDKERVVVTEFQQTQKSQADAVDSMIDQSCDYFVSTETIHEDFKSIEHISALFSSINLQNSRKKTC